MEQAIFALIVLIIMVVTQIIKSIKENAEAAKHQKSDTDSDLVIITQPKRPVKQTQRISKAVRPAERQSWRDERSVFDTPGTASPKRQALTKELAPQGEGLRFEADPGTLDAANIVAPTIDPTVKPELDSLTGIYDEGAQFADKSKPAVTLNIADYLTKPEGIVHAIILAEILNRPALQESFRSKEFMTRNV